jgi:hypothetical protein
VPRDLVYKYAGQSGARAILASRTLRFSRPSEMNDPFDIYIADLFEMPVLDVLNQHRLDVVEMLVNDPQKFSEIMGIDSTQAVIQSNMIKSSPPEMRAEFEALLVSESIEAYYPDVGKLRQTMEGQRERIVAQFQNAGIFCATRDHTNLLMWAHYADQHRGVVLGFKPDLERDSYLRLLEPVTYTDNRPSFYGSIETMAAGIAPDEAELRTFNRGLVYTKSTHWSYEAEERIYVPWDVTDGQPASYKPFYPEELAELHLGCRVPDAFKLEITAAAKAVNHRVAVYQAQPAKKSYALEFIPVSEII